MLNGANVQQGLTTLAIMQTMFQPIHCAIIGILRSVNFYLKSDHALSTLNALGDTQHIVLIWQAYWL